MSTRSTTHFIAAYAKGNNPKPEAIIYRHSDGYPEKYARDLANRWTLVTKWRVVPA